MIHPGGNRTWRFMLAMILLLHLTQKPVDSGRLFIYLFKIYQEYSLLMS